MLEVVGEDLNKYLRLVLALFLGTGVSSALETFIWIDIYKDRGYPFIQTWMEFCIMNITVVSSISVLIASLLWVLRGFETHN